jgi:NAD+ diphosphatase
MTSPADDHTGPRCFAVRRGDVLVRAAALDDAPRHAAALFPTPSEVDALGFERDPVDHERDIGAYDGTTFHACGVAGGVEETAGWRWVGLRALHAHVSDATWFGAGRAVQLVEWARTHRFCGRCGARTERVGGERAMGCPSCGLHVYPRLSPAVIMVVTRGDELLLARGARFPTPVYSALAGFVEPGESLEEAVAREVREEVGIEVDGIRYVGSQPWPFPNSLMVGFVARWRSGELSLDPNEILDAGWYRKDGALPVTPGPPSIAHRLIAGVLDGRW